MTLDKNCQKPSFACEQVMSISCLLPTLTSILLNHPLYWIICLKVKSVTVLISSTTFHCTLRQHLFKSYLTSNCFNTWIDWNWIVYFNRTLFKQGWEYGLFTRDALDEWSFIRKNNIDSKLLSIILLNQNVQLSKLGVYKGFIISTQFGKKWWMRRGNYNNIIR